RRDGVPVGGRTAAGHRRARRRPVAVPVAARPGLPALPAPAEPAGELTERAAMTDGPDPQPAGNQRGRATLARILAAGDLCFESSGLAVTIDEVAAAAGTTRMTVHRHTGGRGPLVTRLVLRASARLARALNEILDGD